MRRPSLLHLITRLDRGGTVGVVLPLAREAQRRGWTCRILAGQTDDGECLRRENPDLDIRLISGLRRPIHPPADLLGLIQIIGEIRRGRYSLIHTHTSKAGALGRLAACLLRHPSVVHTPHGHVFDGYFPWGLARAIRTTERWLARRTHRLIGVSAEEIEETLAHGVGRRSQFRLVPSAVEFPARLPSADDGRRIRASLGWDDERRVIGFLGRLDRIKGPDLLLRALAGLTGKERRNCCLLLVGSGELERELRTMAAGLAPLSVHFAGWRRDAWSLLSAMDLLVLPSRMEGLGKSAIEGLYGGLPVVATAVGGLRGLPSIAPGRVHLVDDEGEEALRAALRAGLDLPRLWPEGGEPFCRDLRRRFGEGRMIADVFAVYRELLDRRKEP